MNTKLLDLPSAPRFFCLAVLAVAAWLLPARPASAQSDLVGRAAAKLVTTGSATRVGKFKFRGVPGSARPTCPNTSSLRVIGGGADTGPIELDCANWSGDGPFRYRPPADEETEVSTIQLKHQVRSGKLKVKLVADAANPVELWPEEVSFVEVRLAINDPATRYCGRFDDWPVGAGSRLAAGKTAVPCPAYVGERNFYQTLFGTEDLGEETIAELGRAIEDIPTDGRAAWLLGLVHLLRFGRIIDFAAHSPEALDEAEAAHLAIDQAVPLMADDARIPGFAGAAGYVFGVVSGDAPLEAAGIDQMREAILAFPEFNVFAFAGTVPGVVLPSDPLFAEAVDYLDFGLESGCSPFTNATLCGNAGKAGHNVEGTGLLFGDIYAKAGNRAEALEWYEIAALWDDTAGGNDWLHRAMLDDRIATIDERIALYADADPTNDPLVAGTGPENCVFCHQP